MTRAEQKEYELKSALALRAVYSDFPTGSIEASDDPLDVRVILAGNKCIGIEVTDFVRDRSKKGSALNAYQKRTASIVERCEALYRELGGPPIFASLTFDYPIDCGANDVVKWAREIVSAVARVTGSLSRATEIMGWENNLPRGIRSITVYPIGGTREGHFAVSFPPTLVHS